MHFHHRYICHSEFGESPQVANTIFSNQLQISFDDCGYMCELFSELRGVQPLWIYSLAGSTTLDKKTFTYYEFLDSLYQPIFITQRHKKWLTMNVPHLPNPHGVRQTFCNFTCTKTPLPICLHGLLPLKSTCGFSLTFGGILSCSKVTVSNFRQYCFI